MLDNNNDNYGLYAVAVGRRWFLATLCDSCCGWNASNDYVISYSGSGSLFVADKTITVPYARTL